MFFCSDFSTDSILLDFITSGYFVYFFLLNQADCYAVKRIAWVGETVIWETLHLVVDLPDVQVPLPLAIQ